MGKRDGTPLYVTHLPNPLVKTPPRFKSREEAEIALEQMRSAIRSGERTPEEVRELYLPADYSKELVETWAAKYLERWQALADSGDESPNSLRELKRWAQPEGHWGWWWGADARRLKNGDVEEWHRWLSSRGIGPKTRKNVSDGFRAMLRWASVHGATGAGQAWPIPVFPVISTPRNATPTLGVESVLAVLEAIPWERRGIYLGIAYESV